MLGVPAELEVVTMGRVSVDLYPEQVDATLAEVRTFRKDLGGSPTNVAVAAVRLGRRSAEVIGLVAGRALLYPPDGKVDRAVDEAAAIISARSRVAG